MNPSPEEIKRARELQAQLASRLAERIPPSAVNGSMNVAIKFKGWAEEARKISTKANPLIAELTALINQRREFD